MRKIVLKSFLTDEENGFLKNKIYLGHENGFESDDFVIINEDRKHIFMDINELLQNFKIKGIIR